MGKSKLTLLIFLLIGHIDFAFGEETKKATRLDQIKNTAESFDQAVNLLYDFNPTEFNETHKKVKVIMNLNLSKNPMNLDAKAYRAKANLKLGYDSRNDFDPKNIKLALKDLNEVISSDSEHVQARIIRSEVFSAMKEYENALQDLFSAYKFDKENPEVISNIALVYSYNKQFDLAKKWLAGAKSFLKSRNDKLTYWNIASKVGVNSDDSLLHIDALIAMTKLKPNSPWAWHNYAIGLRMIKKYDDSIRFSKKALEIMDFGAARYELGRTMLYKAQDQMPHMEQKSISTDRNFENLLLESHKYNGDLLDTYILLTGVDRTPLFSPTTVSTFTWQLLMPLGLVAGSLNYCEDV